MFERALRILILLPVFCLACGGGSTGPNDPLEDAWILFERGDLEEARQKFQEQVPTVGAAAYTGLGWCYLRLLEMQDAESAFTSAGSTPDALSGRCAARWALQEFDASLADANQVLAANAAYVFSHDQTVDFQDMIWHQAAAYFHLGDFTSCLDRIQAIDPAYLPDAGLPLEDALLAKIEALADQLS